MDELAPQIVYKRYGGALYYLCSHMHARTKTTFLGRLRNLRATLTAYIFGVKHDIHKLASALQTTRGMLHITKTT